MGQITTFAVVGQNSFDVRITVVRCVLLCAFSALSKMPISHLCMLIEFIKRLCVLAFETLFSIHF